MDFEHMDLFFKQGKNFIPLNLYISGGSRFIRKEGCKICTGDCSICGVNECCMNYHFFNNYNETPFRIRTACNIQLTYYRSYMWYVRQLAKICGYRVKIVIDSSWIAIGKK